MANQEVRVSFKEVFSQFNNKQNTRGSIKPNIIMAKTTKTVEQAPVANVETVPNVENNEQQAPVVSIVPEPTSEKLEALKGQQIDLQKQFGELALAGKFGTPEINKVGQDLYKVGKDIEAEIAAIKTAQRLQEIEDKKSATIKELHAVVDLYSDMVRIDNDYRNGANGETMETSNAANAAYKAQFDRVANMLTGKLPSVTTPKTGGTTTGSTKGVGAELLDKYKGYREAGLSDTDARKKLIKEDGYNDGTVGIRVLAYLREIGERD